MMKLLLLFYFITFSALGVFAQLVNCNLNYFVNGSDLQIFYRDLSNNTTGSTGVLLPNNGAGLAVSTNFSGNGPNPTFYTVVNGIYFYYNGTTWVSTGHSSGGTAAVNPGGSGPYIYNIVGGTGQVYRYDGSRNSVLAFTVPGYGGPYDVIGDAEGNAYLLINSGNNRRFAVYSPTGQLLCEYPLNGLPSSTAGGGYSVINGVLYVNINSAGTHRGVFNNGSITFTSIPHFEASDYGSCAFPPLSSEVVGSNNSVIDVCAGETISLTASTTISSPIYSWSGPGIVSGQNSSILVVNQPGTYVVEITSGGGLCTSRSTISHVVNINNVSVVVDPVTPVCVDGDDIQLSASVPDGTWSASCGACVSESGLFDVSVAGPGVHEILYFHNLGCTEGVRGQVVVNDIPIINAGADVVVCLGESVVLSASGGVDYTWTPNVTDGVAFVPVESGLYSVVGRDVNGCIGSDDLTLTVSSVGLPVFDAVAPICSGELFGGLPTLSLNGFEGTWLPDFNNLVTTTYTFNTLNECVAPVLMTVQVVQSVLTVFDAVDPICVGMEAPILPTISLNGVVGSWDALVSNVNNGIYTFTPNDGLCASDYVVEIIILENSLPSFELASEFCFGDVVDDLPTVSLDGIRGEWFPVIDNENTTSYWFTPYAGQCAGVVNHLIEVHPLPFVNAGSDMSICAGDQLRLLASGAQTYIWSNSLQNGQTVVPDLGSTVYSVSGIDFRGCQNSDSFIVVVSDIPAISWNVLQDRVCSPAEVTISYVSSIPLLDCVLTVDDVVVSRNCNSDVHDSFSEVGFHDVLLTARSIDGCVFSTLLADAFNVEAQPIAHFSVASPNLTVSNPVVVVDNHSSGATSFFWDFGFEGNRFTSYEPTFSYPDVPGNYTISLIASSEFGCVDTFSQVINVADVLIYYIPNAFTPDGNEYNQFFRPVFRSGFDPYDFTMILFNRWGEMVFETHDVLVGWNGEYAGKPCPTGVYTWVIKGRNSNDDGHFSFNGHVNLLR